MAFLKRPKLIADGWEEHHRLITEGAMTAICEIRGPEGPRDFETGLPTPGELIASDVACRVLAEGEGRGGQPTAQPTDTRAYHIAAPVHRVPELTITDDGPILYVTGYKPGHAGDPQLIGRPLKITNVYIGSLVWERVLSATTEV